MAERLGIGLQNQVQQFDSAWHLFKRFPTPGSAFFLYCNPNLVTAFRAHTFSIGKPGEIPKFMGTTGGDCSRQEEASADIDL